MRETGNEKLLTLLERVTKATRYKTIDTDFVGQSDVSNHYCINQGMKRNTVLRNAIQQNRKSVF
jgi:hypothetical protein